MKELFKREILPNFDLTYINKLREKIDVNNLHNWTYKKTLSLFDKKHENEYLYIRFLVLNEWIKINEKLDYTYYFMLKDIISALGLNEFLTASEKKYLYFINDFIFTSYRNLKSLIVDFPLINNESFFFHYNNIYLSFISDNKVENFDQYFDIYLGDKRIIFTTSLNVIEIKINSIIKIKFNDDTIIFYTNNMIFTISSDNVKIIEISIKRLYKFLKLGEVWITN